MKKKLKKKTVMEKPDADDKGVKPNSKGLVREKADMDDMVNQVHAKRSMKPMFKRK